MEVVVSVALMTVFSIAALMAVTQGTATSADNRSRIGASGLAERELDFVSQMIRDDPTASLTLAAGADEENPHLPSDMKVGDGTGFAFSMNGDKYKVVRHAELYIVGLSGCAATNPAIDELTGTIVTVTVTWEGMSAGTRPHVASKIFPPNPDTVLGLKPDEALLMVKVTGTSDSGEVPREGIKVAITDGDGAGNPSATTNDRGCATFVVKPPDAGTIYKVALGGDAAGKVAYLGLGSEPFPSKESPTMFPGKQEKVDFTSYEEAASLEVTVPQAEEKAILSVSIRPSGGEEGEGMDAPIEGVIATFPAVFPGTYRVTVDGNEDNPLTVELKAGESVKVTVLL
jgi:hypothetical protein